MKTLIVMGVDKTGHKVSHKVSFTHKPINVVAYAENKLGLVKVSSVMTEAAYNQTKELL